MSLKVLEMKPDERVSKTYPKEIKSLKKDSTTSKYIQNFHHEFVTSDFLGFLVNATAPFSEYGGNVAVFLITLQKA